LDEATKRYGGKGYVVGKGWMCGGERVGMWWGRGWGEGGERVGGVKGVCGGKGMDVWWIVGEV
jgi:hypothetical protein